MVDVAIKEAHFRVHTCIIIHLQVGIDKRRTLYAYTHIGRYISWNEALNRCQCWDCKKAIALLRSNISEAW